MTASTSSCIPTSTFDTHPTHCRSCPNRQMSVFCEMEAASLTLIDTMKIRRSYRHGETIFLEGAAAAGLYCVEEGTVKIVKIGREGKEQIVQFLRPGEMSGHRALLGGGTHTATAIALGPVTVCYIPKGVFFSLMGSDSALQSRIIRLLSEELRHTEERFVATAQHTVRQRLAEALIELKNIFGFEPDGQTLDIRLRRTDIANLVGTAPESVIRMLAEFKRGGDHRHGRTPDPHPPPAHAPDRGGPGELSDEPADLSNRWRAPATMAAPATTAREAIGPARRALLPRPAAS